MGAVLCIGKDLRFVPSSDGSHRMEIAGSPLDVTNIAYSSMADLERLASQSLSIAPASWPFYREIELAWEVPLEDVREKCRVLRDTLGRCRENDLPDDFWLRTFARLLREGWDFCAYT